MSAPPPGAPASAPPPSLSALPPPSPPASGVGRLHAAVLVAALAVSAWWFTRPAPPLAPPASPPADLLGVLPGGAALLATLDAQALAASPAGAALLAGLARWTERDPVTQDCGFDPAAGVTRLGLAIPAGAPDRRDPVLAAVTRTDPERLARCAARVLVRRGSQPVRSEADGFVQVRGHGRGAGPALALRADGLVLLAGTGALADALDAARGRAPSARDDAEHAALRRHLTGAPAVAATLRLSPGWVAAVGGLDADVGPLAALRGLALQAEAGAELALTARLIAADPRAAAALLEFARGLLDELGPTLTTLLGEGPGRTLALSSEGETVRLAVRLAPTEIERALGALALLAEEAP